MPPTLAPSLHPPSAHLAGLAPPPVQALPFFPLTEQGSANLKARLEQIAQNRSDFYGCKIAIGLQTATEAVAAADAATRVDDDLFVWGSITKLVTGSGVLRAVERGDLPSLDTPVHTVIDPLLKELGLGSMEKLFGKMARLITARHLGSMRSGYARARARALTTAPAADARCALSP